MVKPKCVMYLHPVHNPRGQGPQLPGPAEVRGPLVQAGVRPAAKVARGVAGRQVPVQRSDLIIGQAEVALEPHQHFVCRDLVGRGVHPAPPRPQPPAHRQPVHQDLHARVPGPRVVHACRRLRRAVVKDA